MGVDDTQPLISHLIELRKRLLNSIIAILVIFLALVYFANDIYQLVSAPLISKMPVGATMIATDVASPFFTPIKLTFMVSVILSVPIILYQVWAFVAPALYKHERRLVVPLLVSSTLLFYIGMAFAYFVVFPLAFGFLTHAAPEGVLVSTDIRCLWHSGSPLRCRSPLCCSAGWALPRRKTCVKKGRMCWWVPSWWACC